MKSINDWQRSDSGLAPALDDTSPPLALSPQNNNGAKTILEQQAAIQILLNQPDNNIFAYLRLARSLDQNLHYSPGHGSLSSDQVLAIEALRDYADDQIRAWLEQARKLSSGLFQLDHPQGETFQEPGGPYSSSSGQMQEALQAPSRRVSICALSNVVQIEGSYQKPLNPSSVHPQQTLDKANTSHEATQAANRYWCTICEDRHSFKSRSDWRKHEKGHVDIYVCNLGGPLERTEGGSKCILCGALNPSETHLGEHKIQSCGQGVSGSVTCKRRTDLVKHLKKCHNVQDKARGEAIADKWKETTKKQAWSCGFCGHLVRTFGDRLTHIATHFKRGQTLDEWDTTKVIEGLLSQPRMVDAWRTRLAASSLGPQSSEDIWEKHLVKDLQQNLEVGPSDKEHAAALAETAYEARQSSRALLNGDRPLTFASLLAPSATTPTSDYDPTMERAFYPYSNHGQSQFVTNPAETLHSGVPAFGVPMATSNYRTSPSDDGSTSVNAYWPSDPGQPWSPVADQYNYSESYGYQHSNATNGSHIGPTRTAFSDEAETDDMLGLNW